MKKILSCLAVGLACATLVACGKTTTTTTSTTEPAVSESAPAGSETPSAKAGDKVQLETIDGSGNPITIEVPYDASRLAVLDMASLDIIQTLGKGDKVVGASKSTIEYLQPTLGREGVANLGTVKEADLEAINKAKPDVIFIGGRLSKSYDDLSKIAPVYTFKIDRKAGVVASTKKNSQDIAKIFGLESHVEEKFAGFEERINKVKDFAKDKATVVGLVTKGALSVLGNDGRCSLIGNEMGFNNIGVDVKKETSTHGNEASFEFLVEKNPDYLFVMDRDKAINAKDAKTAKEIVENDLTKDVKAIKEGHAVYLANPDVWYIAEGGIHALDVMISDVEQGIGLK